MPPMPPSTPSLQPAHHTTTCLLLLLLSIALCLLQPASARLLPVPLLNRAHMSQPQQYHQHPATAARGGSKPFYCHVLPPIPSAARRRGRSCDSGNGGASVDWYSLGLGIRGGGSAGAAAGAAAAGGAKGSGGGSGKRKSGGKLRGSGNAKKKGNGTPDKEKDGGGGISSGGGQPASADASPAAAAQAPPVLATPVVADGDTSAGDKREREEGFLSDVREYFRAMTPSPPPPPEEQQHPQQPSSSKSHGGSGQGNGTAVAEAQHSLGGLMGSEGRRDGDAVLDRVRFMNGWIEGLVVGIYSGVFDMIILNVGLDYFTRSPTKSTPIHLLNVNRCSRALPPRPLRSPAC